MTQVEGLTHRLSDPCLNFGLRRCRQRQLAQVQRQAGVHDATRLFAVLNKGGAQGGVPRLQVIETAHQGIAIERAREPQRSRDGVSGAVRVQLPENPLPLLCVRQHPRLPLRHRLQGRGTERWRLRLATGSKLAEHAGFKQAAEGQFNHQLLTHAGHHLRHQQRMAAQFEEVVVAADGVQFEDFLPDRRNSRLNACMGRHQLALPVGRLRLRQGLAVHLAVGIERQVVQRQPLQRHHVVGQLRLERGFQLFTQR